METNAYATETNTTTWFEVQYFGTGRNGRSAWFTISDHDTEGLANTRKSVEEAGHPGVTYRVRKVRGYNSEA